MRRLLRTLPWILALLLGLSPLIPPLIAEAQRLAGLNTTSGSLAATNDTLAFDVGEASTAIVNVTGTWSGTISWQGTTDGSTWFAISAATLPTGSVVASTTANGQFRLSISGLYRARAIATSIASGTASLAFSGSGGADPLAISGMTLTSVTVGVTRPYGVKTTPGQVWGVFASNLDTGTPCTLNIYDATAANVTVGTTVPRLTFYLPASGTTIMLPANQGVDFTTAITVANARPRSGNTGALDASFCPRSGTLQHGYVDATILYR